MHPSQSAAARQQRHVLAQSERTDSHAFFNLLTGAQLFDDVEALLPEHRERLFPPTETLSMFLAQVLSPDGSCRQAVDDAAVKVVSGHARVQREHRFVLCGAGALAADDDRDLGAAHWGGDCA